MAASRFHLALLTLLAAHLAVADGVDYTRFPAVTGLLGLEVSDPSGPFIETLIPISQVDWLRAFDDQHILAGTGTRIHRIDVSDPDAPVVTATSIAVSTAHVGVGSARLAARTGAELRRPIQLRPGDRAGPLGGFEIPTPRREPMSGYRITSSFRAPR